MPTDPSDDSNGGSRPPSGTAESTAGADAESAAEADRSPGADEVYCTSCGSIIKEQAEICPECGVRQAAVGAGGADGAASNEPARRTDSEYDISDGRRRELETLANKDVTGVLLVGFLLSPVAYLMVGRVGLAVLNFLTFNYFLLGPIVVPVHCHKLVTDAEQELREAGVEGY